MAYCKYCQQEMNGADGCVKLPIKNDFGSFEPVSYGNEKQFANQPPSPGQHHHGVLIEDPPRCHDCGILPNRYHHVGCDYEECPRCHETLVGGNCECDSTAISSDIPEEEPLPN
jgi:hypothetical protein